MLFLLYLLTAVHQAVAQPLQVGTDKQVFLDGRFIEQAENVALVVNRPRVRGEKLLFQEHPWEDFFMGGYQTVLQEGERIRMWYESADRRGMDGVAYAYSDDGGATWTKPKLGIIEYQGSRENNLVLTGIHGMHVFLNRPDAPDDERYCMYVGKPNRVYVSADGLRWKKYGKIPFLDKETNSRLTLDSQNVIFWDRRIEKYVAYPRFNVRTKLGTAGINRRFGHAASEILGDFGKFEIVLQRDDRDPIDFDFYTTAAIRYPFAADAYYMLPAAYHHTPPPPPPPRRRTYRHPDRSQPGR